VQHHQQCINHNVLLMLLQDYLIAEGYNNATAKGQAVSFEAKYYFSQDGAK
jgi:hypothetical protein